MKEIVSTTEKKFLNDVISNGKRLDGRATYDYRKIRITFGTERGCCQVQIGETRVLAQTSCEVIKPSESRPAEGVLQMNLELSPMASPAFEPGRMSIFAVELNRLLERSVRESKAVDTESLCIVVGEKAWQVRVDMHALNFDGNLLDCSSIAAIASLHHFRRPEVTVSGEEVTIHTMEDREPVPLSIHHMPICITFAFFQEGKYLLVDPSGQEETVMDGTMVVCMNIHKEICTIQMTGSMLLLKDQLQRCCQIAVVKVSEITDVINSALLNDTRARKEGEKFGFAESKVPSRITTNVLEEQEVDMDEDNEGAMQEIDNDSGDGHEQPDQEQMETEQGAVKIESAGVGTIGEGLQNTWTIPSEGSEDEDQPKDVEAVAADGKNRHQEPAAKNGAGEPEERADRVHQLDGSGSEEEETVVVKSDQLLQESVKPEQKQQHQESEGLDLTLALKSAPNAGAGKAKRKGGARKKHKGAPK